MKITIAKWGHSKAVRLPKVLTDTPGFEEGAQLELTIEQDGFRLRRSAKTSRELLAEMVAEARRLGPENEPATLDWGADRGAEIIDDAYSRGDLRLDHILSQKNDPGGR